MRMGKASITIFDLDLITVIKDHVLEEEWILSDATQFGGLGSLFTPHMDHFMGCFHQIAERKWREARGTVRIVQSMSLAVVLMGLVHFDAEAVEEMRREAALEYERKVMSSQMAWSVLWVTAGLPATSGQPSYLTIGHVSEGHPNIPQGLKVAYAEPDTDIGMVICMGETFKHKTVGQKIGDTPVVTVVKDDLAMRRVRPQCCVDNSRERYVMHRWRDLARRLTLGPAYWRLQMACRWQRVSEQTCNLAQSKSRRCILDPGDISRECICMSNAWLHIKFCKRV